MRPGGFQKIGQYAVDLRDFQPNIFHHRPRWTGRGQIAADNFNDSGYSGQGIADLVGQAGRQFAERGQMLGARHLRVMQALNLSTALAQLLHHIVEVAPEISDFVVAPGETDGDIQIALADERNLLLQFDHGALNHVGERTDYDRADHDRSGAGDNQHSVAFRITQRYGRHHEQHQSSEQYRDYRQDCFELPIEAHGIQSEILRPRRIRRRRLLKTSLLQTSLFSFG